jgi:transposase
MEATIFTGWIYDHLLPHAAALKVAHPLMLRAIAAAKKKNDRIDANKIADCLRCDFLPECYMASTEIRERRRTLRYRNLLVRQVVQMKNKIAVLLMEAGATYNKQKLHKAGYFRELLASNQDIDDGLRPYCVCAAKWWFAWGRQKALWCVHWSVMLCCGDASSGYQNLAFSTGVTGSFHITG